ncbi:hypothetical protein D3C74_359850 [compost metagenome]
MLEFLPEGTILEGQGGSEIYKLMDHQVISNFWSSQFRSDKITIIFPHPIKIEGFKLKGVTWYRDTTRWRFDISEKLPDGSWNLIHSQALAFPGSVGPIIDGPYLDTMWVNTTEYRVLKIEFRVIDPPNSDYKLFIEEFYIHRV